MVGEDRRKEGARGHGIGIVGHVPPLRHQALAHALDRPSSKRGSVSARRRNSKALSCVRPGCAAIRKLVAVDVEMQFDRIFFQPELKGLVVERAGPFVKERGHHLWSGQTGRPGPARLRRERRIHRDQGYGIVFDKPGFYAEGRDDFLDHVLSIGARAGKRSALSCAQAMPSSSPSPNGCRSGSGGRQASGFRLHRCDAARPTLQLSTLLPVERAAP